MTHDHEVLNIQVDYRMQTYANGQKKRFTEMGNLGN